MFIIENQVRFAPLDPAMKCWFRYPVSTLSIENSGEIIFEVKIPLYYTLTRDLRECLPSLRRLLYSKLSTSKILQCCSKTGRDEGGAMAALDLSILVWTRQQY
jgi:hypothetical protein